MGSDTSQASWGDVIATLVLIIIFGAIMFYSGVAVTNKQNLPHCKYQTIDGQIYKVVEECQE